MEQLAAGQAALPGPHADQHRLQLPACHSLQVLPRLRAVLMWVDQHRRRVQHHQIAGHKLGAREHARGSHAPHRRRQEQGACTHYQHAVAHVHPTTQIVPEVDRQLADAQGRSLGRGNGGQLRDADDLRLHRWSSTAAHVVAQMRQTFQHMNCSTRKQLAYQHPSSQGCTHRHHDTRVHIFLPVRHAATAAELLSFHQHYLVVAHLTPNMRCIPAACRCLVVQPWQPGTQPGHPSGS